MNSSETAVVYKKKSDSMLTKAWKGIVIYFKDYIFFLYGSSTKIIRLLRSANYHVGFQMMILLGAIQTYNNLNITMLELAPHLVKRGLEY